jgi:basic amino acid/polyamine antiporter, APA family
VLVQIVMLARLFYGMASRGLLPGTLARVETRTGTPALATLLAGAIVLAAALLVPFEQLLVLANAVTLGVFALVDLALWRVHRRDAAVAGSFAAPRWVPPLGALLAIVLMLAELLG